MDPAALSGQSASSSSSPKSESGRTCRDDFVSIKTLGEGSMGTVLQVMHRRSGNVYAMKAVEKKKVRDHNLQAQLVQEIQSQMTLSHSNLLRCLDYFEESDTVYIILELASGGDLYQWLRKHGPLKEPEAAHVFAQVCEAVNYLHKEGLIHRDLKPENILLTEDMTVKIADFGWAAKFSPKAGTRNTFCGTLCMLAPEMVSGKEYDARVDVWACGVLLFEMLTGFSPFDKGEGIMETCKAIVGPGLSAVSLEQVPVAAQPLLTGLLQREASQRWLLEDCIKHQWVQDQRKHSKGIICDSPDADLDKTFRIKGISVEIPETPKAKDGSPAIPETSDLLVKTLPKSFPGQSASSSPTYQSGSGNGLTVPVAASQAPRDDCCLSPFSPSALPRGTAGSAGSSSGGFTKAPSPRAERESVSTVASLKSDAKFRERNRELLQQVEIDTPPMSDKLPTPKAAVQDASSKAALLPSDPKAPPSTPDVVELLPGRQPAPPATRMDLVGALPPRTQLSFGSGKGTAASPTKGSGYLKDLADSDSSEDERPQDERSPFGVFSGMDASPHSNTSRRWSQTLKEIDPGSAGEAPTVSFKSAADDVPSVYRPEQRGPAAKAVAQRSPSKHASSQSSSQAGSSPSASPKGSIGHASHVSAGQASNGGAATAAASLTDQLLAVGFSWQQASEASKRTSSVEAAVGWLVETGQS